MDFCIGPQVLGRVGRRPVSQEALTLGRRWNIDVFLQPEGEARFGRDFDGLGGHVAEDTPGRRAHGSANTGSGASARDSPDSCTRARATCRADRGSLSRGSTMRVDLIGVYGNPFASRHEAGQRD